MKNLCIPQLKFNYYVIMYSTKIIKKYTSIKVQIEKFQNVLSKNSFNLIPTINIINFNSTVFATLGICQTFNKQAY